MTDQTSSDDDTTPDLGASADPPATARPRRTRELIAAGAVGLLVAGGLAGFGIGRATSGDDGPQFVRHGQFGPGHHGFGRPGPHGPGGFRGPHDGPRFPGHGGQPNRHPGDRSPADGPDSEGS